MCKQIIKQIIITEISPISTWKINLLTIWVENYIKNKKREEEIKIKKINIIIQSKIFN